MEFELGQRILLKNIIGTVRWKGPVETSCDLGLKQSLSYRGSFSVHLENQTNESLSISDDGNTKELPEKTEETTEVLGVEWDDWRRGKHNGTVDGKFYFEAKNFELCQKAKSKLSERFKTHVEPVIRNKATEDNIDRLIENHRFACSFVLPSDVSTGISLAGAIHNRYLMDNEEDFSKKSENCNGKVEPEFVGRSDAVEFFSQTRNLYTLGLQSCGISSCGDTSSFEFPKVKELYLCNNLIYSLDVIAEILNLFPKLEILDLSGNILDCDTKTTLTSPGLRSLILNHTLLNFEQAISMAKDFPKLQTLALCNNFYVDLGEVEALESLQSIDLSDNLIWNWHSVLYLIVKMPNLSEINLCNNKLCNFCVNPKNSATTNLYEAAVELSGLRDDPLSAYDKVEEIYLDGNFIYDWGTVADFAKIFRRLKVLKFKLFPLEREVSPSMLNLHRQVLISIFPNLQNLNRSQITKNERINAERYYLTLSNRDSLIFLHTNDSRGLKETHKERLEKIHERREDTGQSRRLCPSMVPEVVQVCLVPDADSDSYTRRSVRRSIPSSTTVRDLKTLCSKIFLIKLSDIILVYNDGKMPLCEKMDDDDTEIQQYGIGDGYNIRVQTKLQQL